jgi:Leucine-rich repeat (LRR) protein
MENNINVAGTGGPHQEDSKTGFKIIGITLVLLLVLAVLYWGGRKLLQGTGQIAAPPTEEPGFTECTTETTYTDFDRALREAGNVCALVLEGKNLTVLSEDIGFMSKMLRLDVSGNQLTALPETIGFLGHLRILDASNNQLTALPETIGFLGRMQEFNISNNRLLRIPDQIGWMMDLRVLDLGNNQLTTVTGQISWLGRLQTFNLQGNPLSQAEKDKIKQSLSHVPITF